jgi:hypothetical protein
MRWTKVRKLVHDSFADSVRGRVKVNVTNADPRGTPWADTCTRGWISVDRRVIARVDPHHLRRLSLWLPRTNEGSQQTMLLVEPYHPRQEIPAGAQAGTFMDLQDACWQYLHSSLNDSLHSPDPFVSSLAVLNAKVGRTRLERALTWELHPLTGALLHFRLEAEKAARKSRSDE